MQRDEKELKNFEHLADGEQGGGGGGGGVRILAEIVEKGGG